jgi:hypothetical protein
VERQVLRDDTRTLATNAKLGASAGRTLRSTKDLPRCREIAQDNAVEREDRDEAPFR